MATQALVDDPNRDYGDKVVAVEPGGVEFIPLDERHGTPRQLFWTWTSPNMEFATIGVGILGPLYFGLGFWQSVAAIVLGTGLRALVHGVLSSWGPGHGLVQMVISRSGFGFLGNILPSGINALVAGIGWFAVNSVSGALALNVLVDDDIPRGVCLVFVVLAQMLIAFFGHNLVHAFEKYAFPVLTVVFVIACIVVFSKAHPGSLHDAGGKGGLGGLGGFLVMFGATFGYAAGWNPYASDYTRYLPRETKRVSVGLAAGLGVFLSCCLLEIAGTAVVAAGGSAVAPGQFTALLPTWLGKLALACICIGAIAANAINIYSGSVSFMAMGVRFPTNAARAAVAVVFGVIGLLVAFGGLDNAGESYENFLLIISYWIGPWLGVVLIDRLLRRGTDVQALLTDKSYTNWAGPIAMLVSGALSIWLFSDQTKYHGLIARDHTGIGDITFEVGFVLSALIYVALYRVVGPSKQAVPSQQPQPASRTSADV